jgi:hypothetical protein
MGRHSKGNWPRLIISGALIPCLVLFTTGCESVRDRTLTGKLWSESKLNLPAAAPNAEFFRHSDNRDVLVTYDELRERNDGVRRRAFFFKANLKRLEQHKKPRFVSPGVVIEMNLVPVTAVTNNIPPPEPIVARLSPASQSFTLVWDGQEYGPFDLPVYADEATRTERALLTPLTVTGDVIIAVAIVAVVGGVIVLYAYARSYCGR